MHESRENMQTYNQLQNVVGSESLTECQGQAIKAIRRSLLSHFGSIFNILHLHLLRTAAYMQGARAYVIDRPTD